MADKKKPKTGGPLYLKPTDSPPKDRTKPYKYGEKERARRFANRVPTYSPSSPTAMLGESKRQTFTDSSSSVSNEGSGTRTPPSTSPPKQDTPPADTPPADTPPAMQRLSLANIFNNEIVPGITGSSQGMSPITGFPLYREK